MRILVLGGAGQMGRVTAAVLAGDDAVERVVVTDLDERNARSVADRLGPKVSGIDLDVLDEAALAAALRDCDLVANSVGPFFRFGVPILTAAIAAGRDYVDICDDWEPTLQMLELDEAARQAGVTALVGMGASPGIANLLACTAARELDTVDDIITGWNIAGSAPPAATPGTPNAAVAHGIHQITGTIRVLRNGRMVDRPALEQRRFHYPGIGPARGWTFGHPEAVTLHRNHPHARENVNLVIGQRWTIALLSALRYSVDRGLLSANNAARIVEAVERRAPARPASVLRPGAPPPMFAVLSGTRAGVPATAATALGQVPGLSMAEITGIPLAVAARLLPTSPGVHTPESLLDPDVFFAALAPHCLGAPAPHTMTITTRSWVDDHTNAESLSAALLTALLVPPRPSA
ncbi:saccharopine dehydrogenase family protein [Nocardia brasiliensis]|uniref:Saccharopine dehydrogenase n=1 Tax=Nocardia brasiliensis (strain ATCC 700358 / HUJEG-1) TaxID=1133849 RepID=K0EMK5_NOCB7|nr:saccharopine dehydrogenase NADP-binding domain-containing protein [Nocardia brasiliensis]AFT98213.1 saccharopine dehydrogenase [Nocardia brasiliensis ATCC 700358]OCF90876.1 saccharopine dehydrogenase [Nocardia brasiliensis]